MVFAQSKSARETGFAIRGREKIAQEERLPTFHQETKIRKREKGEGMVCLSFTLIPLSGSCRKRLAGTSALGYPRNCSQSEKLPSHPQPQLPRPACLHWV